MPAPQNRDAPLILGDRLEKPRKTTIFANILFYPNSHLGVFAMFPYKKFTINTSLHPEIVRQKLLAVVEPRQAIGWNRKNNEKPYEGEVGEHSFQINRIINYRNSFLPIIKGRIYPEGMGSKIDIKMAMHPFVVVFMSIWLGIVGSTWILAAIATIAEGKFDSSILVVSGMLLVGLLLPLIGFKPEANSSKQFLIDLLDIS